MSAGYGIIWIKTFNQDDKPDAETAKKVFDYALENIDWFCNEDGNDYGDFFRLEDNVISTCGDGLDIKNEASEASYSSWIKEIAENIKPTKMVVYILSDYRESYSNGRGAKIEIYVCNGEKVKCVKDQEVAFASNFDFFLDSSYGYPVYQGNYKYIVGLYKSKKTGKCYKTTNYLEVHCNDDDYDNFIETIMNDNYYLCFGDEVCYDENGNDAYTIDDIKSFSDEPNIDDFEMSDEDIKLEENEDGDIDFDNFEFVELVEEDADY